MKNWARMRECTKMSCCNICRTTLSRKLDGLALDDSLMYILAHITGMLGMKQLVYGTLLVTGWKNVRTWSGAVRLGLRLDEIFWSDLPRSTVGCHSSLTGTLIGSILQTDHGLPCF